MKMTGITPYTAADLPAVKAMKMREIDQVECRASSGLGPTEALLRSIELSNMVWVAWSGREVIGVAGVAPLKEGIGAPWLLAAEELVSDFRCFAFASAGVLASMKQQYTLLMNYVAVANTKAIRWLKWLGFEFDTHPITILDPDVPFVRFYAKGESHV